MFNYPLAPPSVVFTKPGDPGAGAIYTLTVPDNFYYYIIGCLFTLTCSAVAGNRFPRFTFTDGTNDILEAVSGNKYVANDVALISAFVTATQSTLTGGANYCTVPLPQHFFLAPGFEFVITPDGLLGGDTIADIRITTLSWVTPKST